MQPASQIQLKPDENRGNQEKQVGRSSLQELSPNLQPPLMDAHLTETHKIEQKQGREKQQSQTNN